ncbi:unnamed protein product, partial [Oikopleura dioica]
AEILDEVEKQVNFQRIDFEKEKAKETARRSIESQKASNQARDSEKRMRSTSDALANLITENFSWMIAKSSDQGAQTSMYCICSPEAETSLYYKDCAKGEVKIKGKQNLDEAQEQLWNLSLKFVQDNCKNYCFI